MLMYIYPNCDESTSLFRFQQKYNFLFSAFNLSSTIDAVLIWYQSEGLLILIELSRSNLVHRVISVCVEFQFLFLFFMN